MGNYTQYTVSFATFRNPNIYNQLEVSALDETEALEAALYYFNETEDSVIDSEVIERVSNFRRIDFLA
jgi:hypothetical protein